MLSPDNEAVVNDIMMEAGLIGAQDTGVPSEAPAEAQDGSSEAQAAVDAAEQEAAVAQETPAVAPAIDPQMYQEMLNNALNERLNPLQEKINGIADANKPPMSEEEAALQELKERMGLTQIEEQNRMLKEKLEQYEQMQMQAQLKSEIDAFKAGKPENAEQIVMEELNRLAQTNPAMAAQFDNPTGWDYIYRAKMAEAAPKTQPDPIIGTGNSNAAPQKSAFERAAKGEEVSQIELGMDILNLVGG